ncbi:hypothetical protein [Vibrio rumoiensis]|uniref:hypothetical protein n=1 Tax=Vibrio rumoiensis TaxID=76258 RepID=UPI0002FCEAA8|nr:hypothetical protein [Vibrio rumoiensis]
MLLTKIKRWIARYDAWCEELGLTSEYKRSCCVYKVDPAHDKNAVEKKCIKNIQA